MVLPDIAFCGLLQPQCIQGLAVLLLEQIRMLKLPPFEQLVVLSVDDSIVYPVADTLVLLNCSRVKYSLLGLEIWLILR